jgi:hypothetical protein
MPDEPDPPRRFYTLKPKQFEAVNSVPPPPTEAPAAETGGPQAVIDGPIDVRALFKSASADPGQRLLTKPGGSTRGPENDVHAMLRENHARAEAAGLNALKPVAQRHSRRRRDYIALLVAGNVFIAFIYSAELFLGFQVQCLAARMPEEFWNLVRFVLHQPAVFALAGLGMVFYSGCLTWLMFGIMEDY